MTWNVEGLARTATVADPSSRTVRSQRSPSERPINTCGDKPASSRVTSNVVEWSAPTAASSVSGSLPESVERRSTARRCSRTSVATDTASTSGSVPPTWSTLAETTSVSADVAGPGVAPTVVGNAPAVSAPVVASPSTARLPRSIPLAGRRPSSPVQVVRSVIPEDCTQEVVNSIPAIGRFAAVERLVRGGPGPDRSPRFTRTRDTSLG